jgi:cytidine deaminase
VAKNEALELARAKLLVDRTTDLIVRSYRQTRHQIAAGTSDDEGDVFFGLHVEAMVGRASVCAEGVALSNAVMSGARSLRLVTAVRLSGPVNGVSHIVPPCGLCREVMLDYAPEIEVVLAIDPVLVLTPLADLLPRKYVGTKW